MIAELILDDTGVRFADEWAEKAVIDFFDDFADSIPWADKFMLALAGVLIDILSYLGVSRLALSFVGVYQNFLF